MLTQGANESWERAKKEAASGKQEVAGRKEHGRLQSKPDFSKMTGKQYMDYVQRRSGGKF